MKIEIPPKNLEDLDLAKAREDSANLKICYAQRQLAITKESQVSKNIKKVLYVFR